MTHPDTLQLTELTKIYHALIEQKFSFYDKSVSVKRSNRELAEIRLTGALLSAEIVRVDALRHSLMFGGEIEPYVCEYDNMRAAMEGKYRGEIERLKSEVFTLKNKVDEYAFPNRRKPINKNLLVSEVDYGLPPK